MGIERGTRCEADEMSSTRGGEESRNRGGLALERGFTVHRRWGWGLGE